jgi:hypothetical protein
MLSNSVSRCFDSLRFSQGARTMVEDAEWSMQAGNRWHRPQRTHRRYRSSAIRWFANLWQRTVAAIAVPGWRTHDPLDLRRGHPGCDRSEVPIQLVVPNDTPGAHGYGKSDDQNRYNEFAPLRRSVLGQRLSAGGRVRPTEIFSLGRCNMNRPSMSQMGHVRPSGMVYDKVCCNSDNGRWP